MKKFLHWIVKVLIIIGALNWGLVGFFKYNLVTDLFGVNTGTSRVIFGLIGLAGLWALARLCKKVCCCCGGSCGPNCACSCHKGQGQGQGQSQHHHQ